MKFEVECDTVRTEMTKQDTFANIVLRTPDGQTYIEIRAMMTLDSPMPKPGEIFYVSISKKVTLPVLTDIEAEEVSKEDITALRDAYHDLLKESK